jgi:hypothetical protein
VAGVETEKAMEDDITLERILGVLRIHVGLVAEDLPWSNGCSNSLAERMSNVRLVEMRVNLCGVKTCAITFLVNCLGVVTTTYVLRLQ